MIPLEERRQNFREQLLYEFLNPKQTKKRADKSPVGLSKKDKFLKKEGNVPEPGEKPVYLPAFFPLVSFPRGNWYDMPFWFSHKQ
jgi:hypothetical protein